jgi:D-2-hydroxyacid dehydrogenase (NADP+)
VLDTIGVHRSVEAVFPPDELRDRLADVGPTVAVVDSADGVDALVTFTYDDSFLDCGLQWIHSIQSGVDRFPFEVLEEAGTTLTNSTGIHADVVGETVVGYLLSFARRLHGYRSNQTRREWERPDWDEAFTAEGETVCTVGLGTLGRGVAARADALGMDVVGVKRTPTPVDHVREVYPAHELHDAVEGARFVVLAVPLTPATSGLVGEAELAAMRSDAYLVNVARGEVLDQSALVAALDDGTIRGAALDVFETEPLPETSPLWDDEEVIVTPHAAAATGGYVDRIAALVRENVRRVDRGESLANRVV